MSTLKVNTIQNTSGGSSSTPEQIEQGRAKAWVNFNGTGTIAIRDSFNVSSITDNGTGDTTITLTNAMSNTNYAVTGAAGQSSSDPFRILGLYNSFTTTTFRVRSHFQGGTPYERDGELNCCAVFGD